MKKIEIEKLVQWAMREELPKGEAVSASAWDVLTQVGKLGTRVDTSRDYSDPGMGFVDGEPHADALVVADAIKALPRDVAFADEIEVRLVFGELAAIAGDGIRAIASARFDAQAIMISKSAQGSRPAWFFDTPSPRQMFIEARNTRGECRVMPLVHGIDAAGDEIAIKKNRGRAFKRDGEYSFSMSPRSPLVWTDPVPLHVAHSRAEYITYVDALDRLVDALAGKLSAFEAIRSPLPRAPWITGALIGRVFCDGLAEIFTVPLPLQPKRAAGDKPIESAIERKMREGRNASRKRRAQESPEVSA